MRTFSLCLCLVWIIGCSQNKEVSRKDVRQSQPTSVDVDETTATPPATPEQTSARVVEPQRSAYEEHVDRYNPHALVVQRDKPFMLDKETQLKVAGQPVHYWGIDEYQSLVIQYEEERSFRGRTVRNPIILPVKVKSIEGTPNGTIAGDAQIHSYTLHILSATDTECRYTVAEKEKTNGD